MDGSFGTLALIIKYAGDGWIDERKYKEREKKLLPHLTKKSFKLRSDEFVHTDVEIGKQQQQKKKELHGRNFSPRRVKIVQVGSDWVNATSIRG